MKKILIITYDMIPHAKTWGGCQRMYYLAKALIENGFPVKILALRTESYNDFGKELLTDVIFPNTTRDTELSESKEQEIDKQLPSTVISKTKGLVVHPLKSAAFFMDGLVFNEIQRGNGFKTYLNFKHSRKEIEKTLTNEIYDVVICSGPPFNVFRVIPLIRKSNSATKIIMDYRDPWNFWHTNNPYTRRVEKRYQKIVDKIICTTDSLCDDMSKEFGIDRTKYVTITNGFTGEPLPAKSHNRTNKMRFIYSGAISIIPEKDAYRDTRALMKAIGKVRLTNPDIVFTFVGSQKNDSQYVNRLQSELGDCLEILPPVSTEKANQMIEDSDVCILIHTADDPSGKYLVSGKAYDYINARKFIFSIARNDSQHAKLIEKYKIGINVPNETEAIEKGIIECVHYLRDHDNDLYADIDINQFSRATQIKKYIQLIEKL